MQGPEDHLFSEFRRTGDPALIGEVYDLVASDLLSVARRLTYSTADAEDVLQNTFLTAIEVARQFDPERRLRPWLLGILTNQARHQRTRAVRAPDPQRLACALPQGPESEARRSELDEHVGQALLELDQPYHTVLTLRLRHGLDAAEIADALRRPAGTVRAQLSRGMELLRRALPVGLTGAFTLVLGRPARGMALLRQTVFSHAARHAAASPSFTWMAPVALMKYLVIACSLGVIVLAWKFGGEAVVPGVHSIGAAEVAKPVAAEELARAEVPTASTELRQELAERPAAVAQPATGRLIVHALDGEVVLPGAVVLVDLFGSTLPYSERRTSVADEAGTATFDAIAAGPIRVSLLRGSQLLSSITAGEETELSLRRIAGLTVEGEVVDASGQPFAGAEIWLSERWQWRSAYAATRSDQNGRFRLDSVSEDHSLGARARGYAPSGLHTVRGTAGAVVQMRLTLDRPGASLRGTAVRQDGTPVASALVLVGAEELTSAQQGSDGLLDIAGAPLHLLTDERGRFEARDVPLGSIPVQARAPGLAPARLTVDVLAGVENMVELVLAPEARVRGTVRDENDEPLAGARVFWGNAQLFAYSSTISGEDGSFELAGLGGVVSLEARRAAFAPVEVELTLAPGAIAAWDPVLAATPQIHGVVVDAGNQPSAGWQVVALEPDDHSARYRSQPTGPDGRFAVDVESYEPYTLWVQGAGGWRSLPAVILEDVVPGPTSLSVRVEAPGVSTGSIALDLRGPEGGVVTAGRLTLWHNERRIWRDYPPNADGEIAIDFVQPGTVNLEVHAEQYPRLYLGGHAIEAGEILDLGEIQFERGGVIEGTLAGVPEEALASLSFLLANDQNQESGGVQRTGLRFTSAPLARGQHTLIVRGDFIASQRHLLDIHDDEVFELDLELEAVGLREAVFAKPPAAKALRTLSCSLFDAAGERVWMQAVVRPDEAGVLGARVSAQPGTYRLVAETNNGLRADAPFTITGWEGEDPPQRIVLFRPAGE